MARDRITSLIRGFLVTIFIAFVFTAPVLAGSYVLHPAGFGPDSYAAWKSGEGLTDNNGSNHALYFQKMTATTTFAAGVAVFKGFEGLMVSDLTALEFKWGLDGHCGAGAPRFNLRVDPDGAGPMPPVTHFIGCASMTPGPTATAP